ncbi:MAG: hypothetical protein AVW06_02635 [Hadesarchaea archaeon DG-33-1]|nr:MAG: hypothetical protein AVW06_02635 [Hadesarchaea archaeon DG-33-1]
MGRNVSGEVYKLNELSKHDEFVEHFVGQTIELRKKRELETPEHELNRLIEIQWAHAKRMFKLGTSSWIFGLSMFFLAVIISDVSLLGITPPILISLLIFVAAVPILISAVRIRKFGVKTKRLERVRRTLLAGYQRAVLQRIDRVSKTTR